LVLDFMMANAFPKAPKTKPGPNPQGVAELSSPLAQIPGFMHAFVDDVTGSSGLPTEGFFWALGAAVLSMASFFASLWSLAMSDRTGKFSSAVSLAGSFLSLTVALAFTLVVGFSEDKYGLGVLSTIVSGVSLFTSAYSLKNAWGGPTDVKILSGVSTLASFGSLGISIWTLF